MRVLHECGGARLGFHIEAEVRERSIGEQLRGISNTGVSNVRDFTLTPTVLLEAASGLYGKVSTSCM